MCPTVSPVPNESKHGPNERQSKNKNSRISAGFSDGDSSDIPSAFAFLTLLPYGEVAFPFHFCAE